MAVFLTRASLGSDCCGFISGGSRAVGFGGIQFLANHLTLGVPDIPAMHQIDHVFTDILGMVADALQGTSRPGHIHEAPDGSRILHHQGDALARDLVIFLINELVFLDHRLSEGQEDFLEIVGHFPTSLVGKILKRQLREQIAERINAETATGTTAPAPR